MIWDLGKISSGWAGPGRLGLKILPGRAESAQSARRFQTLLPTSSNHSIITYPTLVLGKVSTWSKKFLMFKNLV